MSELTPDQQSSLMQNGNTVEKIDCIIGAIYDISFAHYLKRNGFVENNLDESKQWSEYRKPTAWPSQARFIFSLKQMREAYAKLGQHPRAAEFMTDTQIVNSQRKNARKNAFWSILGETRSAANSFQILENDEPRTKIQQRRKLARAFRLVLFQQKVEHFRETQNFLALLRSVNREKAKKAFSQCLEILPFPESFMDNREDSEETDEESDFESFSEEPEERQEEPDVIVLSQNSCDSIRENVISAVRQLIDVQKRVDKLSKNIATELKTLDCFSNSNISNEIDVKQK